VEQAEEHRDLQEHRQATHERVGLLLLVELHELFLHRLPVALVLGLQLLDLGLQRLHGTLRLDLLDEDREEDHPDRDHEEDDRQDPVPVRAEHATVWKDLVPQVVPAQQDPGDRGVDKVHHFAAPDASGSASAARAGGTGS
jgi:hypothetical protein